MSRWWARREGRLCPPYGGGSLLPHHDLAEVLVGFHVLERLADLVERKHLVDRQLQFARIPPPARCPCGPVEISRISSIERVRKVTPI